MTSSSTILASTTPWPVIALGVAAFVALCLWGLFRRGSIAHRAREDGQPTGD